MTNFWQYKLFVDIRRFSSENCRQTGEGHRRKSQGAGSCSLQTRAKQLFFGQKPTAENEKNIFCIY